MILETKRLILRPWREDDAEELYRYACNLMTKERWQKVELFRKQKETLDTFLEKNAITEAQYNKSFGDLQNLMGMHGVE